VPSYFFLLLLLVPWIIRLIQKSRESPAWKPDLSAPALHGRLDDAERMLLRGERDGAIEILKEIEPPAKAMQGPDGCVLRARFALALADYIDWSSQPGRAVEFLRGALTEIEGITDPDTALELKARAEATLSLFESSDAKDGSFDESGRSALRQADRIRSPEVLFRLVRAARDLGRRQSARGQWTEGRAHLEMAVALAERLARPESAPPDETWDAEALELFWTLGRRAASEAARELGQALISLGELEAGAAWLDRGIALLEGGTRPMAQLGLAEACLERAMSALPEPIEGAGARAALLERTVESAVASGLPAGRAIACRADDAIASIEFSNGRAAEALTHLRRAYDHVKDLKEPGAALHAVHASLRLGQLLEETGDASAAIDAFRQAMERGRVDVNPETRLHATNSAFELHRLLLTRDLVGAAREVIETLEVLVPGLAIEPRQVLTGYVARNRGLQLAREGKLDEARASLEQAESTGLRIDGPNGWNLVRVAASDLGGLELRAERWQDAERHFRRALEAPTGLNDSPEVRAIRAEIGLSLGQALARQDRPEEALAVLRRSLDEGRGCGNAHGREVAALAALGLGDLQIDYPDERRRLYEIAASLGRLSGRERGREVAEAVEARLREMAE
jgi:tetratricopeptide (TPR) repeat protein